MTLSGPLQLLVYLLIGALIVGVVFYIVNMLSISQPLKNIILAVISVIVVIWLILTFFPNLMG